MSNQPASTQDVVVFQLADQRYGLRVQEVIELLLMVNITHLPDLPQGMLGLINYRGEVMPLIDLRQVFEMSAVKIQLNTLILVTRCPAGALALLVDRVEGVQLLGDNAKDVSHGASEHMAYIDWIAQIDEELLMMLNLARLFERFDEHAPT